MARAFTPNLTNEDYTPSGVTASTVQDMSVWSHTGAASGADYDGNNKRRPWIVHLEFSGFSLSTLPTSFTASLAAINRRISYEMLKRGWVVFCPTITQGGAAISGEGAAPYAGSTKYQSAAAGDAAWNKDICYALQHIHAEADTYGIDVNRGYGVGSSSGFTALMWGGARDYVEGELGGGTIDRGDPHPLKGGIVGFQPQAHYSMFVPTQAGKITHIAGDVNTVGDTVGDFTQEQLNYFSPTTMWRGGSVRPPLLLMSNLAATDVSSPDVYDLYPPEIQETDPHTIAALETWKRLAPDKVTAWAIATSTQAPTFGTSAIDAKVAGGTNPADPSVQIVAKAVDWLMERDLEMLGYDWTLNKMRRTKTSTTADEWHCVAAHNPRRKWVSVEFRGASDIVPEVLITQTSYDEPDDSDSDLVGAPMLTTEVTTPNSSEPHHRAVYETTGAVWVRTTDTTALDVYTTEGG